MEIPITVEGLLSVAGVAAVVALLVQWIKEWVSEPRVLNVIALGIGLLLAEIAVGLTGGWTPRGALEGALLGIGGAALATFGYETVVNLLGKLAQTGTRSDAALREAARLTLVE